MFRLSSAAGPVGFTDCERTAFRLAHIQALATQADVTIWQGDVVVGLATARGDLVLIPHSSDTVSDGPRCHTCGQDGPTVAF